MAVEFQTAETEFDRQFPFCRTINLNPIAHQVVVVDHDQIALRAGPDLCIPGSANIRLFTATAPELTVLQQKFIDDGGARYRKSTGNKVLDLTVNTSYGRGRIYLVDRADQTKYVLFYLGKARFWLYSQLPTTLGNAPHRDKLEEILMRARANSPSGPALQKKSITL